MGGLGEASTPPPPKPASQPASKLGGELGRVGGLTEAGGLGMKMRRGGRAVEDDYGALLCLFVLFYVLLKKRYWVE